ncbi:MAG: tetratricopeptide repeat protein [Bacteroidaceae bacterium]|nr:tetratricopeptide repeat protein [Bacteroidaceae bacterium]
MTFKKTIIACLVAAVAVPAFSQYEGTQWYERIGSGQDSVTTRQNLSMFNQYVQNQSFMDAYEVWRPVIEKAPFANLRIYTDGAYVLQSLIQSEQDVAKKKKYLDELLALYDLRLKNLAGLNSFARSDLKATRADVLYPKAYAYTVYSPGVDPTYTHEKAYNMFAEAGRYLEEEGGREVKGYMLDIFFRLSYARYQADNNGFREQFLQDYLESKELCDRMLQLAKEETDETKAARIVAEYDQPLNNIEGIFAESGAANRELIIAMFTPKVEANKDNLEFLRHALTLMSNYDCDDDPLYYKAAEYAYKIEPSYESAIALAQKYSNEGKTAESIRYYNSALDLCTNNRQKANIALRVASAMTKAGDYTNATAYLDKAAQFNPDLRGKCLMQRAVIATRKKNYSEALALCDQAIAADITLTGHATRLKTNIQTTQAHNAEYARQRAEYDRQQAERKAEEDFWKGNTGK